MKKYLLTLIVLFCLSNPTISQTNPWAYLSKIKFPDADSLVYPYLCTVDSHNRVWALSSKALAPKAHNAIYYANLGDTVFTKFIDFDLNGDSDTLNGNVGALRGIVANGNSIYVSFSVPYPKYKPFTLSGVYRYDNADTNSVFKIVASPSPTYGYGSFIHGIDMSRDSIIFAGISFGTTFRTYNFSKSFKNSAYGTWILPDPNNPSGFSNQTEPGGFETKGIDLIRDVALVPNADYKNPSSVFYTSRNSLAIDQKTGGIAVWTGGIDTQPGGFTPSRVVDFDGYLSLIDTWPYGIDVDNNSILWVAGADSTRKWVKGFSLDGINAEALYDLPSSTSKDIADENGAPFARPSDVSITDDGGYAYVIDAFGKCAFLFHNLTVGVNDYKPVYNFDLGQNYPNPFNPSTRIKFSLSEPSKVKLTVSDVLGRIVKVLVDENMPAGQYSRIFDGNELSSGVYIYSLSTGKNTLSKKMILVK
jgi:hypothetical protein